MRPVEPLTLDIGAPTPITLDEPYDNEARRAVLASEATSAVATILEADAVTVVATAVLALVSALPLVYQGVLPAVAGDQLYVVRTTLSLSGGRTVTAERLGVPLRYSGERT